jgi:hypothetical protein
MVSCDMWLTMTPTYLYHLPPVSVMIRTTFRLNGPEGRRGSYPLEGCQDASRGVSPSVCS